LFIVSDEWHAAIRDSVWEWRDFAVLSCGMYMCYLKDFRSLIFEIFPRLRRAQFSLFTLPHRSGAVFRRTSVFDWQGCQGWEEGALHAKTKTKVKTNAIFGELMSIAPRPRSGFRRRQLAGWTTGRANAWGFGWWASSL
jgi:hypothetical protein